MNSRIALLAVAALALPAAAPVQLPQGWTAVERELWWNSPQGSRIVPYDWFQKLEQSASPELFAAPAHMAAYGYLPSPAHALNPDALPIGFAKERDRATATAWLGMTCAACHTGALRYQGRTVLLDGAGAMVDTQAFDHDLSTALAATASDDARFARFADRLGAAADSRPALRGQLAAVARTRAAATGMNTPPHDHGPGRFDAQGVIENALTATALDRPANARPPAAPVRLPWVWNAAGYTDARHNAGIGPLLRNIGKTLGFYGTVDVGKPPAPFYPSSVNVPALEAQEALLRTLDPPAWPADIFPPVDTARAERGAAVFGQACAACHLARPKDASGLSPMLLAPLDQRGADPGAARSAMTRPAETGVLEGRPIADFGGPVFGLRAGAAEIAGHIGAAVATQIPRARLQAGSTAYRQANAADPARPDVYQPIPLAGAWAGAPYLHNGSVANLTELLTPAPQRAARFTVGGRDFDPALVGYPADTATPGYVLDTTLPGNGNAGHEYGTTLPDSDKASLVEYLKTL